MDITFYFKETKKGFTVKCDLMDMSIHENTTAWGKSKDSAISNLTKKWNKKVAEDFKAINENKPDNVTVEIYPLRLTK